MSDHRSTASRIIPRRPATVCGLRHSSSVSYLTHASIREWHVTLVGQAKPTMALGRDKCPNGRPGELSRLVSFEGSG